MVDTVKNDIVRPKPLVKLASGVSYLGNWANNTLNGEGLLIFPDGTRYSATWQNGLISGKGNI